MKGKSLIDRGIRQIFASSESKIIHLEPSSCVNTLRVSIDLHALLCHLRILQKVQRHPDQMAFDLVEFLPDFLHGHEGVVDVALFELVVLRDKRLVIGEGFDCFGEEC